MHTFSPLDKIRIELRRNLFISSTKTCFKLLSIQESRRLKLVSAAQVILALVDLVAVSALGLVGSLTVYGIQSKSPEGSIFKLLDFFGLNSFSFQAQVGIIGAGAAILLVFRTGVSAIIQFRTLRFLSLRGAVISSRLVSKLLNQNLLAINRRTSQENLFALTTGVNLITVGIIGTLSSIFADLVLLGILFFGLLLLDPIMALSSILYFAAIGISLYFLMHKRVNKLAQREAILSIKSNEKILEILQSFRELTVRSKRGWYSQVIANTRHSIALNQAELSFMPNISKYILEIGLVFGGVLVSAVQFILKDASSAIASMAIFLVTSARVAPAVLRLQTALLSVKQNLSGARLTFDLIDELKFTNEESTEKPTNFIHHGFRGEIDLLQLSFRYPGNQEQTIKNVSLNIRRGEFVGLVGPSGSGKSTLVDLILGVLPVESGMALLDGKKPLETIQNFPGAVAYVPQEVFLTSGTVLENIALGFADDEIDLSRVAQVVEQAGLTGFMGELPDGIRTRISERGSNLSGGQKQRIGIARALYTNPKLLVLDEATSALDGTTEREIVNTLLKIKGDVTLLVIAHRLTTLIDADRIVYLKKGNVIAQGSIAVVRKQVPDFDKQFEMFES